MVLLVCIAVVAAVSLFVVLLYNRLVSGRNEVKNAWNAIDVQLKRRHDLIPNLIELVKGYASHERQTLNAVTEARAKARAASGDIEARGKVEKALSAKLTSLLALAEAYPDLKASEHFTSLKTQLVAAEDKIGWVRQYYNDTALRYKNRVEMFPGNLVAGLFNFKAEPFFQLEEDRERAAPQIKL